MSLNIRRLPSTVLALAGLLALLSLAAAAQSSAPQPAALRQFSFSQMECSDYFAPRAHFRPTTVIGARGGMLQTMFTPGAILYLDNAGHFQPGDQVRLLRAAGLQQQEDQFPGQSGVISRMGAYVQIVGRAKILRINGHGVAIARLNFSCQPASTGDFAVAWRPIASPTLPRTVHVQWVAPVRGAAQLVVMGRDQAGTLGSGDEVYLTGGAAAGAQVGQAWTIFRNRRSPSNAQFQASAVGLTPPDMSAAGGVPEPADILGRLVVIRVEPRSATAIITVSRAPILAGDEAVPAAAQ